MYVDTTKKNNWIQIIVMVELEKYVFCIEMSFFYLHFGFLKECHLGFPRLEFSNRWPYLLSVGNDNRATDTQSIGQTTIESKVLTHSLICEYGTKTKGNLTRGSIH